MSAEPATSTVTEKCACGASLTVTSKTLLVIKKALQDWRGNHRHTEPSDPGSGAEVHAVTGTHHQAGSVRRPTGRRAVGFQLKETP